MLGGEPEQGRAALVPLGSAVRRLCPIAAELHFQLWALLFVREW